jgi:hypothetical protein
MSIGQRVAPVEKRTGRLAAGSNAAARGASSGDQVAAMPRRFNGCGNVTVRPVRR